LTEGFGKQFFIQTVCFFPPRQTQTLLFFGKQKEVGSKCTMKHPDFVYIDIFLANSFIFIESTALVIHKKQT
jgi:hypothetical protein